VGGRAGRKFMRENEPVLFVPPVRDGEIILENGEILSEKRQLAGFIFRFGAIPVFSTYERLIV
jgi:hypothetical protein